MEEQKKPQPKPEEPQKKIKRLNEQVRVVDAGNTELANPNEADGEPAVTLNGICP